MRRHRDLPAIRHDAVRIFGEFLDEAVDVVPTAAIEPGRVIAKLVKNFVHLEGGEYRFDQHSRADCSLRESELRLSVQEDVIPEPRFEMALNLWQIKVWSAVPCHQFLRVVEKEQGKVEQRPRHRLAIDEHMLFGEVPTPRADKQYGCFAVQRIMPACVGIVEGDRLAYRISEVY